MKLTNNLFAYVWKGNDNNCNTYVFANVLDNGKHIIIDPGHVVTPYLQEPALDRLTQEIKNDGLKSEDIGLVILTHAHPDHTEAASRIKAISNAKIAMLTDEVNLNKRYGGPNIDVTLTEGELKLDSPLKSKIEIIRTPGHSSGHISIYWPQEKALAVGDVVFYHNIGRCELPGGDAYQLKSSIERLMKFEAEYLLCGHPYDNPGVIQGKENVRNNFEFILKNVFAGF